MMEACVSDRNDDEEDDDDEDDDGTIDIDDDDGTILSEYLTASQHTGFTERAWLTNLMTSTTITKMFMMTIARRL